jgi:hypothetical protein
LQYFAFGLLRLGGTGIALLVPLISLLSAREMVLSRSSPAIQAQSNAATSSAFQFTSRSILNPALIQATALSEQHPRALIDGGCDGN